MKKDRNTIEYTMNSDAVDIPAAAASVTEDSSEGKTALENKVTEDKPLQEVKAPEPEEGTPEENLTDTALLEKAMKERNIFKRFGNWFRGAKAWKKVLVILLAIIIVVGGAGAGYVYSKLGMMNQVTTPHAKLTLEPVDGYINILVLGVDNRNMKKSIEGSRTDMIMIASLEVETGEVTLTSIFRDTYVKLGDTETFDKITHACVYGGPQMTMDTINQLLDIEISNYVVVNFKAVAQVVDAVGGITVDVQENEVEQLNKYTKQTADNIGYDKYELCDGPGEQTLCGVQAVSYGRIRKGCGDDFQRTSRMRVVVKKTFAKMKSMDIFTLNDIADSVLPNIETNISNRNILALSLRLPKYSIKGGDGFPYNHGTGLINGTSYVFGMDLATDVVEFHKKVLKQENYTLAEESQTIISRIESNKNASPVTETETLEEDQPSQQSEPSNDNQTKKSTEEQEAVIVEDDETEEEESEEIIVDEEEEEEEEEEEIIDEGGETQEEDVQQ